MLRHFYVVKFSQKLKNGFGGFSNIILINDAIMKCLTIKNRGFKCI